MLKIGINGFGRIGRAAFRLAWERKDIQIVGINDLADTKTLAHLLKYDSIFHTWPRNVSADDTHIMVDDTRIVVCAEKDPAAITWGRLGVDVVLECTGRFTKKALAETHITSGAKAVVISSPSDDTPTVLMGVNHDGLAKIDSFVVNNASCTTNSVAPVMAVLEKAFGVKKAMMTTVHSLTAEQNVVDGIPPALHPDLRRARASSVNMIPTSTGAAKATSKALPHLKNIFDGIAVRVPTLDVSLSDCTVLLARKTTVEEVNDVFVHASQEAEWKGILGVSHEPLVSSDFIGSTYSAVVDLPLTRVVDGDLVKVCAWYDNEWGYAARLVELAEHVGKNIGR